MELVYAHIYGVFLAIFGSKHLFLFFPSFFFSLSFPFPSLFPSEARAYKSTGLRCSSRALSRVPQRASRVPQRAANAWQHSSTNVLITRSVTVFFFVISASVRLVLSNGLC